VGGNTILSTTMFKCRECESTEFKLMLQPSFQGSVDISNNENNEVIIRVNEKEFVADLMFMNQFAVCAACESIRCWDYYFPKDTSPSSSL
jgi:hypothetical protein